MNKKVENIVRHAEVSEKSIEKYLVDEVKKIGGICLKYSNSNMTGYPDRIVLLPNGKTIWIVIKSKGKHTTKVQDIRITQMEEIGHQVYIADSKEEIKRILKKHYDL